MRAVWLAVTLVVVAGSFDASESDYVDSMHTLGRTMAKAHASRKHSITMLGTRMSNSTTGFCDIVIADAIIQLMNQTSCRQLMLQLESDCVDTEMMCVNQCLDLLVFTGESLSQLGCNLSTAILGELCSEQLCLTNVSVNYTTTWINGGCGHLDRCNPFTRCAMNERSKCGQLKNLTCPNNCSYHGVCERVGSTSKCKCDKGYGRSSVQTQQDCSEPTLASCPNMCYGHGNCVPSTNGSMQCNCFDGFTGIDCSGWNRCEDLSYCSGHGSCTQPFIKQRQFIPEACVCEPGFTGQTCNQVVSKHCPNLCSGRGKCAISGNNRTCVCEDSYTGVSCEIYTGPTCPSNCSGNGLCQANGSCLCNSGFGGPSCSNITNECLAGCYNGFCRAGKCLCVSGFTGDLCNVYNPLIDTSCKALSFCNGLGVCNKKFLPNETYATSCICFEGFSGTTCNVVEANFPNECPNYCNGHGSCVLMPSPHCQCQAGWSGSDCATSGCPLSNGLVCSERGVCELHGTNYGCTCDQGYTNGALNACEVSQCPGDCSGHGRCVSVNTCKCNSGFGGNSCNVTVSAASFNFAASPASDSSDTLQAVESKPAAQADSVAGQPTEIVASTNEREDEEETPYVDLSMCLNRCSDRGSCLMGKCSCQGGYMGDDCSKESPALSEEQGDELDALDMMLELQSGRTDSMARLWD